jgi:very-short-patch-repair endonuclease
VNNCFLVKDEFGNMKREKTCLQRFGVVNPLKNKQIAKNMIQTKIHKYGKNCFKIIGQKIQNTVKIRHNVNSGFWVKNKDGELKRDETLIKNFGSLENANLQTEKKRERTFLKRYGDTKILRVPSVMKKRFSHFYFTKPHKKLKHAINLQIFNNNFETEQFIKVDNLSFSVDELNKEKKIILFVDGDYWHANPNKYSADDVLYKNTTAAQIWEKDETITNTLENHNYIVLRFWESDIYKNLDSCVSNIKQALELK